MTAARLLLTTLAATLVSAAPASAAEPASGEITLDKPRVEWSGEAAGSLVQFAHYFRGEQIVEDCVAPMCDSFTLTVGPGAESLIISAEDASGYTEMQIRDSSGAELFWSGGDDGVPTVYEEYDPAGGVYTVEILTDALAPGPVDDPSYSAFAEVFPPVEDGEPVVE